MAVDVVASLQRLGAEVVASFQFPVAVSLPTGSGGRRQYAAPPDAKRRRQRIAQARDAEAQDMAEMLMALAAAGVLD
jgi:hypothetical protein